MILGDIGEVHLKQGNYELAKTYVTDCITILKDIHNEEDIVKRLCLLFEIEDLMTTGESSSTHYLNQASKLALQHSSKEEILTIKFSLSTKYFRQGLVDLSSLLLETVYQGAKEINHNQLIMSSELYLAAIQLSYYLESNDSTRLEKAKKHLASLIQKSQNENILFLHIRGLFLSSILSLCAMDTDYAIAELKMARKLSIQTENKLALEKIDTLLDNIQFIKKITVLEGKTFLPDTFFLKRGAKSFLQEFTYWVNFNRTRAAITNFGYLFIIQRETGPVISHCSSNISDFALQEELLGIPVIFTLAIGQGSKYYTGRGLYGPLPLTNSNAIIYTILLKDSEFKDPRFDGKNYCIYTILLPLEATLTTKMRESLFQFLTERLSSINDVKDIPQQWFDNLRAKILVNCFTNS
jgi:hypothetical protein